MIIGTIYYNITDTGDRDVIFRRTAFQLGSDILSALEPFRAEPFEMAPAQLYIEPKWSRISKLFK